jgi:hypothetical protein
LGPRPCVSIIMVVRLERWMCFFLVAERARLPLPLDPLLPFDLRRANLSHLDLHPPA